MDPAQRVGARAPKSIGSRRACALLVDLIDDESLVVWAEVRSGLERLGKAAIPSLRRVARHGSPRGRTRARLVLLHLGRVDVARRLIRACARDSVDLERGLWLLSRFEEPSLDVRPYSLALDAMAAEVLRRIERVPPGEGRCRRLVDYLASELGYQGDENDYHHPDNVYLHRAIVRKRGLPLTLAAIYAAVARRAGMRAALVGLPGHVVLRLHDGPRGVLVDPFHRGALLSQRDCMKYLADYGLPFNPRWFDDADDASMLRRQLANLANSLRRRGLERETELLACVGRVLEARLVGAALAREREGGSP